MSNAECEFVCRIAPVFQQSCDVVDRLRSYHDERFALRLMESASSELLGEVRFRAGASGLPQSITNAHVEVDDVRNVTSRDLDVVFTYERQLRAGPMSITYCDGVFTFGATIDCSKGHQNVAEQLLQHHAIAFLGTLGPFRLPDTSC